jgi:putative methylase
MIQDVKDVEIKCDTVIMNPPFGAQKSNQKADRKFIEKGFKISQIIYSLHLSQTTPFINKMISSLNGKISYSKDYAFPIKHIYNFHEKRVVEYDVTLLRTITKSGLKKLHKIN